MARSRLSAIALIAAILLSLHIPARGMAATDSLSADELAAAMEERAAYGLPADEAAIAEVLRVGVENGLSEWGMVITDEEMAALDLPGRAEFEAQATEGPLRYAQSLPNYAGAYFDQQAGGSLTILLTSMIGAEDITRLAPPGKRPVTVQLTTHSYEGLKNALLGVREAWSELYPDVELLNVAIETRANRLRAEVDQSQLTEIDASLSDLIARIGVPVHLTAGVRAEPAACSDRHHCTAPIRAGSWVHSSTGVYCALGFWVSSSGGDERFVTAGHCSGPTAGTQESWTHDGYGSLGSERPGSNWYYTGNYDMMIVYGPDSQAGNRIYAETRRIISFGNPVVGSSVCASLTKRDLIDCGTITDDFVSYTIDGHTLFGGSYSGISIIGGDSGSPVYKRLNTTQTNIMGVVSGGAYFALTTGVLQNNGYTVVNW